MSTPPTEPASPCIKVCQLDPATGLCHGCLRTLQEIADWSGYGSEEKRAVLAALVQRRRPTRFSPPAGT